VNSENTPLLKMLCPLFSELETTKTSGK